MRMTQRRAWKVLVTAAALSWTAFGLLWAQVLVLPDPALPPRVFAALVEVPATTLPARFFVMFVKESSLLLCVFALVGIVLAALARRAGAWRSSLVATVLGAAIVVVSLAPVTQALRTASAEGVPLSISEYLAASFSATHRSPETVTYARPGGEELKLDVWRPPGDGAGGTERRPAVVMVHGGAWERGHRSQMPHWDAWLAARGYVVFDADYRLSPPPRWRDAPADVRCAVGWVKENADRYGVDPDRVALMGHSAGGHLALLAAYGDQADSKLPSGCAAEDTRVAAVAAFYPPTDLTRFYLGEVERFLGGSPGTVPGRYRLSSPVAHVDHGDPPTFLVHGGDDKIVPPEQSELLAKRLRGAGVPRRLVELPWANHTFDFFWGGWGAQITRSTLGEFLERHLDTMAEARAERTE